MSETEVIALVGACTTSAIFLILYVFERIRLSREKKELMVQVQTLYQQTTEIINESGQQHRQIIELRRLVEVLEHENQTLHQKNEVSRMEFEGRTNDLLQKIQELETKNTHLIETVETLKQTIQKMKNG